MSKRTRTGRSHHIFSVLFIFCINRLINSTHNDSSAAGTFRESLAEPCWIPMAACLCKVRTHLLAKGPSPQGPQEKKARHGDTNWPSGTLTRKNTGFGFGDSAFPFLTIIKKTGKGNKLHTYILIQTSPLVDKHVRFPKNQKLFIR